MLQHMSRVCLQAMSVWLLIVLAGCGERCPPAEALAPVTSSEGLQVIEFDLKRDMQQVVPEQILANEPIKETCDCRLAVDRSEPLHFQVLIQADSQYFGTVDQTSGPYGESDDHSSHRYIYDFQPQQPAPDKPGYRAVFSFVRDQGGTEEVGRRSSCQIHGLDEGRQGITWSSDFAPNSPGVWLLTVDLVRLVAGEPPRIVEPLYRVPVLVR